jgi:hypothetical protein
MAVLQIPKLKEFPIELDPVIVQPFLVLENSGMMPWAMPFFK